MSPTLMGLVAAVSMIWALATAGMVFRFETEDNPLPYLLASVLCSGLGTSIVDWMIQ